MILKLSLILGLLTLLPHSIFGNKIIANINIVHNTTATLNSTKNSNISNDNSAGNTNINSSNTTLIVNQMNRLKRSSSFYTRSDTSHPGSHTNGHSIGGTNGFRASDYLNLNSAATGFTRGPNCPNITRNTRFKCAQNLDEQACGCYVKVYRRWLNSSVSVSHEKAVCCSKLEVRNCVERLLRIEKRECKNRWEKEAKRYTELVLPTKEYSCRDYRKQEYCKLDSINLTLIILLITVALLGVIACLGFTGYACYRRYNE